MGKPLIFSNTVQAVSPPNSGETANSGSVEKCPDDKRLDFNLSDWLRTRFVIKYKASKSTGLKNEHLRIFTRTHTSALKYRHTQ